MYLFIVFGDGLLCEYSIYAVLLQKIVLLLFRHFFWESKSLGQIPCLIHLINTSLTVGILKIRLIDQATTRLKSGS